MPKKTCCRANRRLCRPSQGWWGEGAGARRTRGEENYKRFCGVPFQGRRPKGNVIVVVWYTSRREHGYIYIQQINKPTSVPGAVLPVPPEATLRLACYSPATPQIADGRWRHDMRARFWFLVSCKFGKSAARPPLELSACVGPYRVHAALVRRPAVW